MNQRLLVFTIFLAIAGCSNESDDRFDDANPENISDLLLSNDVSVCASLDVHTTVLSAFHEGYANFVAEGGRPLEFQSISATDVDPDIHKISCSAVVHIPENISHLPLRALRDFQISFSVRPSLGSDADYVISTQPDYLVIPSSIASYVKASIRSSSPQPVYSDPVEDPVEDPVREPRRGNDFLSNRSAIAKGENNGRNSDFNSAEEALIGKASEAYTSFRNGEQEAEEQWDNALARLREQNICWGKLDQVEVEYEYHRCEMSSLQMQ